MVKRALLVVLATAVVASAAETIRQGATLHCQLTETLSTRVSLQGDRFTATVTEPFALNGSDVIPAGATLSRVRVPVARPLKKRWVSRPEGGLVGLAFGYPVVGMFGGDAAGFVDRMRRRGQDLTPVKGTRL